MVFHRQKLAEIAADMRQTALTICLRRKGKRRERAIEADKYVRQALGMFWAQLSPAVEGVERQLRRQPSHFDQPIDDFPRTIPAKFAAGTLGNCRDAKIRVSRQSPI